MAEMALPDRIDALPPDAQARVEQLVDQLARKAEQEREDVMKVDELAKSYETLGDQDRLRVSRLVRKAAGRRASPAQAAQAAKALPAG